MTVDRTITLLLQCTLATEVALGDRLNLALDMGCLVVRGRKEVGLERIPNLFHGLKSENDGY